MGKSRRYVAYQKWNWCPSCRLRQHKSKRGYLANGIVVPPRWRGNHYHREKIPFPMQRILRRAIDMLIRNLVSRSVKVGRELREVCKGLLGKRQELRSRMPMRPIQQQLGSYSWRQCALRMLTTEPDSCEYMHGTESGRIYLGFIRVFVFYVTS